ncbi:MAG TPA: hypothetical protein DHW02_16715 [Ktedonobacter sp.]|nr:hypothetical protein [Ktedonobacter sp.]
MDVAKGKIISIAPKPSLCMTIGATLIVATQILVSLVTYPFLPSIVPSHWNAIGQIDGYAPKVLLAILWPLVSAASYSFLILMMSISPRLGFQRPEKTQAITQQLSLATLLFLLVIQLTATAIALGFHIDITFIISLGLSILLIFTGNYMGKLRRNYWAGIRTPWTIASDVVWERTHRFASWLFVGTGLVGIAMSFVPIAHIWAMIALFIVVSVIPALYSYKIYRQQSFRERTQC